MECLALLCLVKLTFVIVMGLVPSPPPHQRRKK
jgi:hypothetical protein